MSGSFFFHFWYFLGFTIFSKDFYIIMIAWSEKSFYNGRRTEDNSRTFGTVSDWASWTGHFFLL